MKKIILGATCALLCVPTTAIGQLLERRFDNAYFFGDSSTDVGNTFDLIGLPVSPPYHNGRFTNGPVWADLLMEHLRMGELIPSRKGGTNFAYGGAQTGFGMSTIPNVAVPNLGEQIREFVERGLSFNENDLVVYWVGHNDVFGEIEPSITGLNTRNHIEELFDLGARRILFGDLGGFGVARYNEQIIPEFRQFAEDHPEVSVSIMDYNSLTRDMFFNPDSFGFRSVTERGCPTCHLTDTNFVVDPSDLANDPDRLLFWDEIHVTAVAHSFIADMAIASVSELLPVPEPKFNGAIALVALLALRKRLVLQ